MATDFQCQRLTCRPQKPLATVVFLSALLAVQVLVGTAMAGGSDEPKRPRLAPLLYEKLPSRIPNEYIVVFKPGTSRDVVQAVQSRVKRLGGTIKHVYSVVLTGFSCTLSDERAVQVLRAEPSVASISSAQKGSLEAVQDLNNPTPNPPYPNWPSNKWPMGLDRTSERKLPLDKRYTYSEEGAGVHVYVIDTGIRATHTEFGGRVTWGINTATTPYTGNTDDCSNDGHGTHMAGTIGGTTVGIAKQVTFHSVRATDCTSAPDIQDYIAAIEEVTKHVRTNGFGGKAVVNFSSGWDYVDTNLNNAVINSMNAIDPATSKRLDIIYVIAAGNRNNDACSWSPSSINAMSGVTKPIVVGAVNPLNDNRWVDPLNPNIASNIGTCLNLFAPGQDILSAGKGNNTSYITLSGTSSAAPHVTGVVARILSRAVHPVSTPQGVWCAMHAANNIHGTPQPVPNCPATTTSNWAGITDLGTGSPNEMLHYGSASDGKSDGDTHITTINGIHYDFQAAGEFVALRDANGLEIQTRQTSVSSVPSVSVNTAIAARVGQHRVSWQPNISGVPDPSGLQLRVDGVVTTIGETGLDLGDGGRILKSAAGDTLEVDFPDGTALFVASHWWADQSQWYLDVSVFHSPATEGIMGAIEQDSWLQPEFAATWGVTDETSLFDYATGLSTKTFALSSVPQDQIPPINSEVLALAQRVCESIVDPAIADHNRLADCAFDIAVTRDPIFAKSHRLAQRIQQGATNTTVTVERNLRRIREEVTLIAAVTRHGSVKSIPTGRVMFLLDGKELGKPVTLDANGQAQWKMSSHMVDGHRVTTQYLPDKDSVFLPSNSLDKTLPVEKKQIPHGNTGPRKHYKK